MAVVEDEAAVGGVGEEGEWSGGRRWRWAKEARRVLFEWHLFSVFRSHAERA